jgi:hypothetical protein
MKRFGMMMALGGVLGFALVTVYGADAISWWNRPLGGTNVLSCDAPIREAITLFIKAQFAVATCLAVLLAGGDWYARRKRAQKAALATTDAPAPETKG